MTQTLLISLGVFALLVFGHRQIQHQVRRWKIVRFNRRRYPDVVMKEAEGFDPHDVAQFMAWCDLRPALHLYGASAISPSYPSIEDYYLPLHVRFWQMRQGYTLQLSRARAPW